MLLRADHLVDDILRAGDADGLVVGLAGGADGAEVAQWGQGRAGERGGLNDALCEERIVIGATLGGREMTALARIIQG